MVITVINNIVTNVKEKQNNTGLFLNRILPNAFPNGINSKINIVNPNKAIN